MVTPASTYTPSGSWPDLPSESDNETNVIIFWIQTASVIH